MPGTTPTSTSSRIQPNRRRNATQRAQQPGKQAQDHPSLRAMKNRATFGAAQRQNLICAYSAAAPRTASAAVAGCNEAMMLSKSIRSPNRKGQVSLPRPAPSP